MLRNILKRVALLSLIMIGLGLILIYISNGRQLVEDSKKASAYQIQALSEEYNISIQDLKKTLNILSVTYEDYVLNEASSKADRASIEDRLLEVAKINDFIGVYFADKEGSLVSSFKVRMNVLNQKRPWFMEIMSGKEYFQSDFYRSTTGDMVITVSMPILSQGRKVGVVGLDIDATKLMQDERDYILINKNGDVFSSNNSNSSLLGENVFLTNPEYIKLTEVPLIIGSTAVSKANLSDGNYLITKVDLSDEFIDSRVRFLGTV
ncbi:Toxin co-regulated pilus biosynthesis protein I chemoreceptor [Vibrio astriarenae]|nr:Toxin co-regulated pilus biosynthesis protein I chemoreceptor [Vibrio sp. C7]